MCCDSDLPDVYSGDHNPVDGSHRSRAEHLQHGRSPGSGLDARLRPHLHCARAGHVRHGSDLPGSYGGSKNLARRVVGHIRDLTASQGHDKDLSVFEEDDKDVPGIRQHGMDLPGSEKHKDLSRREGHFRT